MVIAETDGRDADVALLGLDQHLGARILDWEFGGRR